VNLNRVYGAPSLSLHPTIYAARKLILYAHLGKDVVGPDISPEPLLLPPPPERIAAQSSSAAAASLFFSQPPSSNHSGDKGESASSVFWEIPNLSAMRAHRPSASSRSSNASSRGSLSFPSPHKHPPSDSGKENILLLRDSSFPSPHKHPLSESGKGNMLLRDSVAYPGSAWIRIDFSRLDPDLKPGRLK
jgi:hypothetical protein